MLTYEFCSGLIEEAKENFGGYAFTDKHVDEFIDARKVLKPLKTMCYEDISELLLDLIARDEHGKQLAEYILTSCQNRKDFEFILNYKSDIEELY